MDVTLAILQQRRFKNPVSSVLLLSDGLDEGAEKRIQILLEQYSIQEAFTINTFGYGADHDGDMLDELAKLKDGSFYHIEQVDQVGGCFVDCVGGLISVVAKDGVISVMAQNPPQLPKGSVKIKKVYGEKDVWQVNNQGVHSTKITYLYSGTQRDFVLELELGPTPPLQDFQKKMNFAIGRCTMVGIDGEKYKSDKELKVTLLNAEEESKQQEESKEVVLQYYRVKTAEIMDIAQNLAIAKKYKEAQAVLVNMIKELQASKYTNQNLIVALIQDLTQSVEDCKPQIYHTSGHKRMLCCKRGHYEQRSKPFGGQQVYRNKVQSNYNRQYDNRNNSSSDDDDNEMEDAD